MISRGTTRILISFILFLGVTCFVTTETAYADTQSGTVDVNGVVPGPPPVAPPTIESPADGSTSAEKNIVISGNCQATLVVKLFRNDVFAGSGLCGGDNHYTLNIDLVEGRNDLIARQYDTLDQASPDSDTITVYYVPPVEQPTVPSTPVSPEESQVAEFQLIIDYDYNFQNVTTGMPIHLPIHFVGGKPPYAISVSWGDGNQSLLSRETAEQFFVDYTYTQPGIYIVKVRISDATGTVAYLQFVLTVNGIAPQASFLGIPLSNVIQQGLLPALTWPTIGFAVVVFGLGFMLARFWPILARLFSKFFFRRQ